MGLFDAFRKKTAANSEYDLDLTAEETERLAKILEVIGMLKPPVDTALIAKVKAGKKLTGPEVTSCAGLVALFRFTVEQSGKELFPVDLAVFDKVKAAKAKVNADTK